MLVCDFASSSLLYAPFLPSAIASLSVLPPAASYTLALTEQECPHLAGHSSHLWSSGGSFRLTQGKWSVPYFIQYVQGVWTAQSGSIAQSNLWHADAAPGHSLPLKVMSMASAMGPSGAFQVIHDATGDVAASGSVASAQSWAQVGPVAMFYERPGDAFHVAGAMSADSWSFRPLLRYGTPEIDADVIPGGVEVSAGSLRVGSPAAMFWAPTTLPQIGAGARAATPVELQAYLLVGFNSRGVGAPPDPIVGSGASARLQFSSALSVAHSQYWNTQYCGASLAVPADSGLEGLIILFQWAFVSPGNPNRLVYSGIGGARIAAAGQAGGFMQSSAASGQGPNMGVTSAAARRRAFESWMSTDPRVVTPGSATFVLLRSGGS